MARALRALWSWHWYGPICPGAEELRRIDDLRAGIPWRVCASIWLLHHPWNKDWRR